MKIFKDRQSAGKLLAKRLWEFKGIRGVIVLGIPRGGVVVAKEVAEQLNLPLDIIVTRKIGAPNQPELALGAVDSDGEVVWDQELLVQQKLEIKDETKEIKRREKLYRHGKEPLDIEGKVVLLIDDGIATGATALAAVNYLKRHGVKKVILTVPVASNETRDKLSDHVDELVVLEAPQYFQAVGQFYQEFLPVSDEEVIQLLS